MKKYSFSCAETNEYSIGMYYSIYNLYTAINHQDPYIPITFICHCYWEGKCPKKNYNSKNNKRNPKFHQIKKRRKKNMIM